MNKKAKLAVLSVLSVIILSAILILPFLTKAQDEVSYNNNLAFTPSEIKDNAPLTVEKDDNWQVEWHETYAGLTHREYVIAIQNQKETTSDFDLSIVFNELTFDTFQVNNVQVYEWQKGSKDVPIIETIESCEFPSAIDNETGEDIGNLTICYYENRVKGYETVETYDWVKSKDVSNEEQIAERKQEGYGVVSFGSKLDKEEANVKYLKLSFDVPITRLPDGSFGSSGRVAILEGNLGKEYHPWWNGSVSYKKQHIGNYPYDTNNDITIRNMPCLINSSWGWGDVALTNYVWGKCDYNFTHLYYNNASDFYFINGSENTQLAVDTEGETGKYDSFPKSVWDNFSVVLLPEEQSGTSVTVSGQIGGTASLTGTTNITSAYIKKGFGTNDDGCLRMPTASVSNFNSNYWTLEIIVKFTSVSGAETLKFGITPNGRGSVIYFNSTAITDVAGCVAGQQDCIGTQHSSAKSFRSSWDSKWGYLTIVQIPNGTDLYWNGEYKGEFTIWSPMNFRTSNPAFDFFGNCYDSDSYTTNTTVDFIRISNVSRNISWITAQYNMLMNNYSFLGEEGTQTIEGTGDDAILQGIINSTINPATTYLSQQVYIRNVTGQHQLGRFDYVAVSGNQRWAFNYISLSESTSNFTYMVNITPVLYVWEGVNLTYSQIRQQVTSFIDSTKI